MTNGIKDEIDTVAQIKIVDQMIVTGVDILVIAPADSKALVRVVQRAIAAGTCSGRGVMSAPLLRTLAAVRA